MDIVTIDFETYYDKDYSLSKITTEAYVRDPRFEVIGVGVKVNDNPTDWYTGENPGRFLKSLDYSNRAILCHNTVFDGAILSWHFGIRPRLWLDTLSMARPWHGLTVGGSLKKLVAHYRLGEKGDEVVRAMGKRRRDFSQAEMDAYASYCKTDVDLTYKLFRKLKGKFSPSELMLIDQTIRMYTEPSIVLDKPLLEQHLQDVRERKSDLMDELGWLADNNDLIKDHLMSNPRLTLVLEALGVDVPMKVSPSTGKLTQAFGKTDKAFTDLLEHDDPRVRAVVAARLGVKSTLEETRTASLIGVAERGPLPIMLNYYGAHCVPGDTEVLTPTGWERLDTWEGGAIAQWNSDRDIITFENAERYVGPEVGKWVRSTAPYMPVEMTLGHTVPVLGHRNRKLTPMAAGDMIGRGSSYVPTSSYVSGVLRSYTPEQTRVLVMVQADGSFEIQSGAGRRLSIFLKKPRKIQRARELLTAAGVKFIEQTYPSWPGYVRFVVRYRDYPKWLSPERKLFGPWIMGCPLDVFIAELQHWDGWVQGGQMCYSTSDYTNAEWIQTAAHLAGMGCAISVREGKGNRRTNYALRFRDRAECMVKKHHLEVVEKLQQSYCVKSRTGYWLARANKHIFITGNTGRFSGGDKMNLQNLPRGGTLRRALCAPKGKVLVASDSAQIEARIVAWVAGQEHLLSAFREGRDVYSEFATDVYGRKITKEDRLERHVGKTAVLGLGYGMGAPKFRATLALGAGGIKVEMDDGEAKRIVQAYRSKYPLIPQLWNRCGWALAQMAQGKTGDIRPYLPFGPEYIGLPNGLQINYPLLQVAEGGFKYCGDTRTYFEAAKARVLGSNVSTVKWQYIYGGKVVENIVQALARIVVAEQMVTIGQRYKTVLQVHDEIVIMVDEHEAEEALEFVQQVMKTPPTWAPDLPVNCEAHVGASYGECK